MKLVVAGAQVSGGRPALEDRLANVLFIMADEHQASAISCLGHSVVRTPNLDRLAAGGTLFRFAYTPSPICVPAHAALVTGRYPGWGHALRDAGIPVTSVGKLHYRRREDPTGCDQQILPMHIHAGVGQVWGSVRNPLPQVRRVTGMLGEIGAGFSKYNRYDVAVAEAAEAWLREPGRKSAPWAGFVGFVAPHFPLTAPAEYLDLYPAKDMPLPPVHPGKGHPVHPRVARMTEIENSDEELGSDSRRREAIAAYFALCTFVDAQIGRVIDALAESGQADRTLVIYASDHGETLGMHGRWGKSVLYREATQLPLILSGPRAPGGTRITTPVSLIDIPPTIADAFGVAPDPAWRGRSLLTIAGEEDDPRRTVFSEYHAANSPSGGFMVADARWKYRENVGYDPELFDLEADPLETRNLAADPACSHVRERMRRKLLDICDPTAVDASAKVDQDRLVAMHGGPDAAFRTGIADATPVPCN